MPATPKYKDSGVIYITSKNIKNREIIFDDVKYISQEDYEKISKKRPIEVGDILIGMIGTIGQVGVVLEDYPTFYGQNIYLLRLDASRINKRYFCEFMRSENTQNTLLVTKNGSTQSYLKANHIEGLELFLPELQLQKRFEEFCVQTDKSKFVAYQETIFIEKILKYTYNHTFRRKNNVH
jgi:type I restriction enzyme S subunit